MPSDGAAPMPLPNASGRLSEFMRGPAGGVLLVLCAVPLGIAMGLVIGKPLGIGGATWLARRTGLASWPVDVRGDAMLGMAMLCGIGFTMSLFIGGLSFAPDSEAAHVHRQSILGGSTVAALLGSLWLRRGLRRAERA